MVKILTNTTANPVTIADTGITIPASGFYIIPLTDYELWAPSEDIVLPVADGTIVVNDGQEDLTKAEGIGLIQGSFIKRDFVDSLKENDRLKVDIIGSLNMATTSACVYMNQISIQDNIDENGVVLQLDNSPVNTNPSVLDISTTLGEYVTLVSGNFEFELQITADTADRARRTSVTTIQKFDGTTWTDILPSQGSSQCFGYHRNNASGENTTYNKTILSCGANDRYRYVIKCLNDGLIKTVPTGTSLVIKQI